jgi:hypothetical protein
MLGRLIHGANLLRIALSDWAGTSEILWIRVRAESVGLNANSLRSSRGQVHDRLLGQSSALEGAGQSAFVQDQDAVAHAEDFL